MPRFKTGAMVKAPGIKIVNASSFLTSEEKLYMGCGFARDLKIKIPGIDKIFGGMVLDNGGHLGRYGLLIYEKYGILQTRHCFNGSPNLDLIRFGITRLKMFAEETGYISNLEYPGIRGTEFGKEKVDPILGDLPKNVYVWEKEGSRWPTPQN